jgi:hypothetical protein
MVGDEVEVLLDKYGGRGRIVRRLSGNISKWRFAPQLRSDVLNVKWSDAVAIFILFATISPVINKSRPN